VRGGGAYGVAGDLGDAPEQVAARRLAKRVAEDKALQKAMAEVMKKMSDGTCPPS